MWLRIIKKSIFLKNQFYKFNSIRYFRTRQTNFDIHIRKLSNKRHWDNMEKCMQCWDLSVSLFFFLLYISHMSEIIWYLYSVPFRNTACQLPCPICVVFLPNEESSSSSPYKPLSFPVPASWGDETPHKW